ncbi:hypothetical protein DHEL01_v200273 [Diaporthe helianthi]|uniref:Uncharacterized protein n=1 Tax=Diaporthe helianthi TaxID=158607 RepID=A0A2P5IFS5_DIAHE|nr:hypothetical protein DHEL01_v200273 [Diaporthe helianthi]
MQAFKVDLPNGSTLSGHNYHPDTSSPAYTALDDSRRPLLIAIHGATYGSTYFDADPKHTAVLCSKGLGVPVVAIDRPFYKETSPFTVPEGKNYHEELAVQLHNHILPALWKEFGRGCGSMVLHCHSVGTPSAIILAGWLAQEQAQGKSEPAYPLSGLTISGFGSEQYHPNYVPQSQEPPPPDPIPEWIDWPLDAKDDLMIQKGTVDPAIYEQTRRLHNLLPRRERGDYELIWHDDKWRALCGAVELPVLIGLAEKDALWVGTEQHVKEFADGFTRSERVEASLVRGAPHCIELSYWAQGWYARCFGWALECATGYAVRKATAQAA